ncbi:hypothetical protein GY45DRAFT_295856 [Cubamyces sp. BRFM 1775]|nr:hypothetical protein GY45DRAFT_295856 [Cubamyces sp. BRFM 1775]
MSCRCSRKRGERSRRRLSCSLLSGGGSTLREACSLHSSTCITLRTCFFPSPSPLSSPSACCILLWECLAGSSCDITRLHSVQMQATQNINVRILALGAVLGNHSHGSGPQAFHEHAPQGAALIRSRDASQSSHLLPPLMIDIRLARQGRTP